MLSKHTPNLPGVQKVFLSFFFKKIYYIRVSTFVYVFMCTTSNCGWGEGWSTQVPTDARGQRALILFLGIGSDKLSHMLAGTDLPFSVGATSALDHRDLSNPSFGPL